jgi:ABC-2 type transport system permease protein
MSTAAIDVPTLELTGSRRIPMRRLIGVELRKLGDTRAGKWLLIAIGLITVAAITIFLLTAKDSNLTFLNLVGVTAAPQGFLLPVLGILLVTSEWSQRTALVTFTLVPARGRVLAAKVVAAVLAGLAAIVVAVGVAALATALFGSAAGWQSFAVADLGKFAILQISGVLQGLAFGLLFLNSAAAIVTYFVLPTAFSILSSLWKAMADVQPWIDLGSSQPPLYSGDPMTAAQWAHLGTGTALWVLLPFVLGLWRVLRAEVK